MSIPAINPSYVDEKFISEAEQVGGSMIFSHGAQKLGFVDVHDRELISMFVQHRLPSGQQPMRWQANSPDYLYCPIASVTPSINAWLKYQPLEGFSKFMAEVMKPAVSVFLSSFETACYVRDTVNGVQRSTQADLIALTAIHAFARDGNLSVHAHPMFWRWGVGEDLGVKSFADRRFVPRMVSTANEIFHLAISVALQDSFGVATNIVNGKCEIVGISKEALETVGTRRKAMLEYLEANDLKPTPQAMANAAINTRPEKKAYSLSERLATWNEQVAKTGLSGATFTDSSPFRGRLKAMIEEFVIQPAKLVGLAYRFTWGKPVGTAKVHDLGVFLEDTRMRTRKEGHKAAVRALMRTNLQGLTHALAVAEKAYKRGRQPLKILPKGVRVVVSAKAVKNATPTQLFELRKRAIKNGWVLRIGGQSLDGGMSQSQ